MHVFSRHRNTYLQIPAPVGAALMSLCATMCRYFSRNTNIYLLLYVSLSSCIFAKIPAHTAPISAPVPAPVSAPVSALVSAPISARLHRLLRGCIAVASPSHRRRIAVASHRHRIASLQETQATCGLHWDQICQRCSRIVARGLKKWSLSSGLWVKP